VEGGRREHDHKHIDSASEAQRNGDVDALRVQHPTQTWLVRAIRAVLHQRRVHIDHVRHHRRSENAGRQQHRLLAPEPRREEATHGGAEVRLAHDRLGEIADADHRDKRRNHRLERPRPSPL
jgi:hypothetical protein